MALVVDLEMPQQAACATNRSRLSLGKQLRQLPIYLAAQPSLAQTLSRHTADSTVYWSLASRPCHQLKLLFTNLPTEPFSSPFTITEA